MGYLGQLDNLIRAQDRGHAVRFTRTVVVFRDGLVVCPVALRGASPGLQRGVLGGLARRGSRATGDSAAIRRAAEGMGPGVPAAEFAHAWPGAEVIPFAVIERIVLTRPRQVSELAIFEEQVSDGTPACSVYLGDLAPERVRDLLGAVLGTRLEIVAASG
ncbi:MAG TPA: hypothetical protein VGI58_12975 [Streptosporangiaceae bacterium]